jgi:hypothetical protein
MALLKGPRKNVARLGRKGGKIAAINAIKRRERAIDHMFG